MRVYRPLQPSDGPSITRPKAGSQAPESTEQAFGREARGGAFDAPVAPPCTCC